MRLEGECGMTLSRLGKWQGCLKENKQYIAWARGNCPWLSFELPWRVP